MSVALTMTCGCDCVCPNRMWGLGPVHAKELKDVAVLECHIWGAVACDFMVHDGNTWSYCSINADGTRANILLHYLGLAMTVLRARPVNEVAQKAPWLGVDLQKLHQVTSSKPQKKRFSRRKCSKGGCSPAAELKVAVQFAYYVTTRAHPVGASKAGGNQQQTIGLCWVGRPPTKRNLQAWLLSLETNQVKSVCWALCTRPGVELA